MNGAQSPVADTLVPVPALPLDVTWLSPAHVLGGRME